MSTNLYTKQTWEDAPSTNSPISAERLNHMETGIKDNNTGVRALETAVGNVQNLTTSSKETVGAINEINADLSDQGTVLISTNVTAVGEITPISSMEGYDSFLVDIGTYYSLYNTNLYRQTFEIKLNQISGLDQPDFVYSWYNGTTYMYVSFTFVNGKFKVVEIVTNGGTSLAVYVEVRGFKHG